MYVCVCVYIYIYIYICIHTQKINQTAFATLNYTLSSELSEDNFISKNVNIMLNSSEYIFQTFSWHHSKVT
jgi:hypothetical protein